MATSLIIGKAVSYPVIRGETFPRRSNNRRKLEDDKESSRSKPSRGSRASSVKQIPSPEPYYREPTDHQLITIGIYGWRKKFLYSLIIIVAIFVVINAALTLWIVKLLNFRLDRIGKIILTEEGIIVDGKTFINDTLSARYIKSRKNGNVRIISQDEILLETVKTLREGTSNHSVNLLSLKDDSVEAWINEMRIKTLDDVPLVTINDNQLTLYSDSIKINNTYGVQFNSSIQSPLIVSDPYHDLEIQSKTRSVRISSANQVNLTSKADISLTSRKDFQLVSNSGKIVLDSENIELKNLKLGVAMMSNEPNPGVYQICICNNGRLFMALPREPCTYDVKICEYVQNESLPGR